MKHTITVVIEDTEEGVNIEVSPLPDVQQEDVDGLAQSKKTKFAPRDYQVALFYIIHNALAEWSGK